jgi:serine/threonine protein kinase
VPSVAGFHPGALLTRAATPASTPVAAAVTPQLHPHAHPIVPPVAVEPVAPALQPSGSQYAAFLLSGTEHLMYHLLLRKHKGLPRSFPLDIRCSADFQRLSLTSRSFDPITLAPLPLGSDAAVVDVSVFDLVAVCEGVFDAQPALLEKHVRKCVGFHPSCTFTLFFSHLEHRNKLAASYSPLTHVHPTSTKGFPVPFYFEAPTIELMSRWVRALRWLKEHVAESLGGEDRRAQLVRLHRNSTLHRTGAGGGSEKHLQTEDKVPNAAPLLGQSQSLKENVTAISLSDLHAPHGQSHAFSFTGAIKRAFHHGTHSSASSSASSSSTSSSQHSLAGLSTSARAATPQATPYQLLYGELMKRQLELDEPEEEHIVSETHPVQSASPPMISPTAPSGAASFVGGLHHHHSFTPMNVFTPSSAGGPSASSAVGSPPSAASASARRTSSISLSNQQSPAKIDHLTAVLRQGQCFLSYASRSLGAPPELLYLWTTHDLNHICYGPDRQRAPTTVLPSSSLISIDTGVSCRIFGLGKWVMTIGMRGVKERGSWSKEGHRSVFDALRSSSNSTSATHGGGGSRGGSWSVPTPHGGIDTPASSSTSMSSMTPAQTPFTPSVSGGNWPVSSAAAASVSSTSSSSSHPTVFSLHLAAASCSTLTLWLTALKWLRDTKSSISTPFNVRREEWMDLNMQWGGENLLKTFGIDTRESLVKIGGGGMAHVYRVTHAVTKQQFALKVFFRYREVIRHEIDIMKDIRHPNCIMYYGSIPRGKELYVVSEYADGGSLADFLHKKAREKLKEVHIAYILRQVLYALKYLHHNSVSQRRASPPGSLHMLLWWLTRPLFFQILHRDIKSANILLTSKGLVKIVSSGGDRQTLRPCEALALWLLSFSSVTSPSFSSQTDFGISEHFVDKKHITSGATPTPANGASAASSPESELRGLTPGGNGVDSTPPQVKRESIVASAGVRTPIDSSGSASGSAPASASASNEKNAAVGIGGSPLWMSPEALRGLDLTPAADVWSLGATAIEVAEGKPPNSDCKTLLAVMQSVLNHPSPSLLTHAKSYPHPSVEFCDFVDRCLKKEVDERATVEELLAHPFILQMPHVPHPTPSVTSGTASSGGSSSATPVSAGGFRNMIKRGAQKLTASFSSHNLNAAKTPTAAPGMTAAEALTAGKSDGSGARGSASSTTSPHASLPSSPAGLPLNERAASVHVAGSTHNANTSASHASGAPNVNLRPASWAGGLDPNTSSPSSNAGGAAATAGWNGVHVISPSLTRSMTPIHAKSDDTATPHDDSSGSLPPTPSGAGGLAAGLKEKQQHRASITQQGLMSVPSNPASIALVCSPHSSPRLSPRFSITSGATGGAGAGVPLGATDGNGWNLAAALSATSTATLTAIPSASSGVTPGHTPLAASDSTSVSPALSRASTAQHTPAVQHHGPDPATDLPDDAFISLLQYGTYTRARFGRGSIIGSSSTKQTGPSSAADTPGRSVSPPRAGAAASSVDLSGSPEPNTRDRRASGGRSAASTSAGTEKRPSLTGKEVTTPLGKSMLKKQSHERQLAINTSPQSEQARHHRSRRSQTLRLEDQRPEEQLQPPGLNLKHVRQGSYATLGAQPKKHLHARQFSKLPKLLPSLTLKRTASMSTVNAFTQAQSGDLDAEESDLLLPVLEKLPLSRGITSPQPTSRRMASVILEGDEGTSNESSMVVQRTKGMEQSATTKVGSPASTIRKYSSAFVINTYASIGGTSVGMQQHEMRDRASSNASSNYLRQISGDEVNVLSPSFEPSVSRSPVDSFQSPSSTNNNTQENLSPRSLRRDQSFSHSYVAGPPPGMKPLHLTQKEKIEPDDEASQINKDAEQQDADEEVVEIKKPKLRLMSSSSAAAADEVEDDCPPMHTFNPDSPSNAVEEEDAFTAERRSLQSGGSSLTQGDSGRSVDLAQSYVISSHGTLLAHGFAISSSGLHAATPKASALARRSSVQDTVGTGGKNGGGGAGAMWTGRHQKRVSVVNESGEATLDASDDGDDDSSSHPTAMASPTHRDHALSKDDLFTLGVIGKGQNGPVLKAIHLPSLTRVALKSVYAHDRGTRHQLLHELTAYLHFDSPYLVSFLGAYYEDSVIFLATEYMDQGSLQHFIKRNGPLATRPRAFQQIAYQAIAGLKHMHDRHALHRDIKPDNILLTHEGIVRLADFGLLKDLGATNNVSHTFLGTMSFLSPERITSSAYTYPADVWSMGLTFLYALTGQSPRASPDFFTTMDLITKHPPKKLTVEDLGREGKLEEDLCDFVNGMLQMEPEKRYTCDQLLAHPFLSSGLPPPEVADAENDPDQVLWSVGDANMADLDLILELMISKHLLPELAEKERERSAASNSLTSPGQMTSFGSSASSGSGGSNGSSSSAGENESVPMMLASVSSKDGSAIHMTNHISTSRSSTSSSASSKPSPVFRLPKHIGQPRPEEVEEHQEEEISEIQTFPVLSPTLEIPSASPTSAAFLTPTKHHGAAAEEQVTPMSSSDTDETPRRAPAPPLPLRTTTESTDDDAAGLPHSLRQLSFVRTVSNNRWLMSSPDSEEEDAAENKLHRVVDDSPRFRSDSHSSLDAPTASVTAAASAAHDAEEEERFHNALVDEASDGEGEGPSVDTPVAMDSLPPLPHAPPSATAVIHQAVSLAEIAVEASPEGEIVVGEEKETEKLETNLTQALRAAAMHAPEDEPDEAAAEEQDAPRPRFGLSLKISAREAVESAEGEEISVLATTSDSDGPSSTTHATTADGGGHRPRLSLSTSVSMGLTILGQDGSGSGGMEETSMIETFTAGTNGPSGSSTEDTLTIASATGGVVSPGALSSPSSTLAPIELLSLDSDRCECLARQFGTTHADVQQRWRAKQIEMLHRKFNTH